MYKWSPTSGNAWARWFLMEALPTPEEPFWNTAEIYLSALCPLFGTIGVAKDTLSAWRNHGDNFTAMQRTDKFERELTWGLERFESCVQATERFAPKLGFQFNTQVWKSNSWFHRISSAVNQIVDHVPSGDAIILADHDAWNVGTCLRGRRCLPYMNTTHGVWEQPNAGNIMVDEIERLRADGAGFFCVTWLAFWLLEWPLELRSYLDKRTNCLVHTRDIAIYKLAPSQSFMRGPDSSVSQPSSR